MEDYLKDAFMLQKRNGYARYTDVAEHFSIARALCRFKTFLPLLLTNQVKFSIITIS